MRKKEEIIFVCYDIKLRDYLTSKNIKWLITGVNQSSNKSFWVYDNGDINVKNIVSKWRKKELDFNN